MSYDGNSFDGYWTSYTTGKSKRCSWNSGGGLPSDQQLFHIGDDGQVYVNPQYRDKGWQDYLCYYQNEAEPGSQRFKDAEKRENEKWWDK